MSDSDVSSYFSWVAGMERDKGLIDGVSPVPIRKGPGLFASFASRRGQTVVDPIGPPVLFPVIGRSVQ